MHHRWYHAVFRRCLPVVGLGLLLVSLAVAQPNFECQSPGPFPMIGSGGDCEGVEASYRRYPRTRWRELCVLGRA